VAVCSGSRDKAARRRDLAVLGHLGAIFDETGGGGVKSLQSVVPYRVMWSDVALHVCHEVVPRSQILYAINGNIVALCVAEDQQVISALLCRHSISLNSMTVY